MHVVWHPQPIGIPFVHLLHRSHHEAGVSSLAAVASAEGVTPQASDESGIERAMQEVLARSPGG